MSALAGFPRITPFLWFDSNAEEAVDFLSECVQKLASAV
jgi:predicted 3-demethylubiquinone-9 3-methyltransferase (glyoxalase superfamily)